MQKIVYLSGSIRFNNNNEIVVDDKKWRDELIKNYPEIEFINPIDYLNLIDDDKIPECNYLFVNVLNLHELTEEEKMKILFEIDYANLLKKRIIIVLPDDKYNLSKDKTHAFFKDSIFVNNLQKGIENIKNNT